MKTIQQQYTRYYWDEEELKVKTNTQTVEYTLEKDYDKIYNTCIYLMFGFVVSAIFCSILYSIINWFIFVSLLFILLVIIFGIISNKAHKKYDMILFNLEQSYWNGESDGFEEAQAKKKHWCEEHPVIYAYYKAHEDKISLYEAKLIVDHCGKDID